MANFLVTGIQHKSLYFVAAFYFLICSPFCFAETFSNQALEKIMQNNPHTNKPVDSIAELVPLLPKELRENFIYAFDSRSPLRTSISTKFPRVILFSKDARFVMTFTGNPSQPGADVVETMSYNDQTAAFEMYARLLPSAVRRGETFSTDPKS